MAGTIPSDAPMLGVAGNYGHAEVALARRFDQLHQLLYAKGGVRPTNAAIEEVAKLLYLRLWATRTGAEAVLGDRHVSDLFSGTVPPGQIVDFAKAAFTQANLSPALGARDPEGNSQPLWPTDEPFRLANAEVLAAAASLVDEIVSDDRRAVADPLGTAFDAFLSGRYDHSGGLGTFLTPSSIARAMADVALGIRDPFMSWDRRSPLVADPYCGTGRFLVAAFEAAEGSVDEATLAALLDQGILGADQSPTATAKTAMNLMLYGASTPHVFNVPDSVTASALDRLRGSLQLILTNPPFGGGKYSDAEGVRRTASLIPSLGRKASIDPALACTVRALDLLADDGVLGIVLPDGIVDGRQFDELVDRAGNVSVAANISLPTSTFALSGTVAKTSAVFLHKRSSVARTVLARAEHVGFVRQAGKAAPDPAGTEIPDVVEAIAKAFAMGEHPEPLVKVSDTPLVASIAADALASLDPSRIDPTALASRARLENQGGVRLGELVAHRRKQAQKRSDVGSPFVSVLHVDELGVVSWPDAEIYEPTTPGQIAFAGEVIVSLLNPSKLRAAVVPSERAKVVCSSEFGVFSTNINPYAVLGLLYHPDVQAQLKPLGRGTSSSRRRIGPSDVLDLIVPNLGDLELDALGSAVAEAMAQVETGRAALFRQYGVNYSAVD